MKIAIVSRARRDPSSGVGGVAAHPSAAFRANGHSCDVISLESVFQKVDGFLNQFFFAVVFPLRLDLGSYDVLDIAAGGGFFDNRQPPRLAIIARTTIGYYREAIERKNLELRK